MHNHKNIEVYNHHDIYKSITVLQNSTKIVASRYHAMILGWIFEKPTFVMSYSLKMNSVIEDLFPEQEVFSVIDDSISNNYEYSIMDRKKLKLIVKESEKNFSVLDELI